VKRVRTKTWIYVLCILVLFSFCQWGAYQWGYNDAYPPTFHIPSDNPDWNDGWEAGYLSGYYRMHGEPK